MPYIRSNYGISGGIRTQMASLIVKIRATIIHDSATGDVVTISMQGYGKPAWAIVTPATDAVFTFNTQIRASVAASLLYITFQGMTGSYGSMAATVSCAYDVIALIASR